MIYFRYGGHIKVKERSAKDGANAKVQPATTFSPVEYYSNKNSYGDNEKSSSKFPYMPSADNVVKPCYYNCSTHSDIDEIVSTNDSFAFAYVLSKNLIGVTNLYRVAAQ